jgi:spore maturation protein CgeB
MIERILFVGDLAPHCRTYQRFRALKDLGYQVEGVPSSPVDRVPGISPEKFWWKVFFKLRLPLDETNANRRMVELSERLQPHLVFVERGLTIRAAALRRVRRVCANAVVLVSYSEDDMFASHNQSVYYRGSLPLYDVVFTTKSYNRRPEELPALGARRVLFVDKAYDRYAHRPLDLSPQDLEQYSADIAFIGTFEENRAQKLLLLAANGFDVRVWGNGWRHWAGKHPQLRIENRPLYDDDYVKALRASKINLCFLRKANRDLQTDRTMELPACGAFMLAERTDEHRRLFQEGREAAYFDIDDDNELIEKVRYYLTNSEERRAVAAAGLRRALSSGYSHHDRLTWMLEQVQAAESAPVLARSV